jgi:anaerobic magnesium-protoporphyrin IX monomethyl ester cyclase
MMKIVLIYLPHPYLVQPEAQAPLGLMYIAAVLQKNNIAVEICSFSSYLTHEAIAALPEADIYGITVTSMELPQANRFAHLIRERFFDSKIVLGGPGTVSGEFVDWNVIDSICQGEGENAVLDIVKDFPNLKKTYIGAKITNLDKIPFPARSLLKDKLGGNIFAYNKNYKAGGSTVILTGRGCPFNCSFCTAPLLRDFNQGVKFRSPENIYDEIKDVIDQYNIRQFRFSDDMFTANRNRAMEIAEKIRPVRAMK